MEPLFPEELKHLYHDIELIGSGGFARVFKARRMDGKVVAVKIPLNMDEETGKSFLKEITSWQRLSHGNIVSLFDANILPIPYLEQEYMEGGSLQEMEKPLEIIQACKIVFNIAEGLKYAHRKGIVHRDLKPQNILLTSDNFPKITDWGMSRIIAEGKTTTRRGYTPAFAAPEQISPKTFGDADERTDVYQLGVIFYNLLTDDMPFKGDDLAEIASAIVLNKPVRPSKLNPDAGDVEHIVLRCLSKRKDKRYQSIEDFQKELAEGMKKIEEKNQDRNETILISTEKGADIKENLKSAKRDIIQKGFFALALIFVLGALLLTGYTMFTRDRIDEPDTLNATFQPTPTIIPESPATSALTIPGTFSNSVGMEFVLIPAGEFDMGSPESEESYSERPVHHVNISKPYYMGKYEVTQKQWNEVMGNNPSYFKGHDLPVDNVSWYDVQDFIKKLNEKEGTDKYRLPSEAEWEYAIRAGTNTTYFFGENISELGEYSWYAESSGRLHPVGQKKSNPWGLYDMRGNVYEWIQDIYHPDYNYRDNLGGAPTDGSAWEGIGSLRVLRGSGACMLYNNKDFHCRSASRHFEAQSIRNSGIGFRLVRDVAPPD